MDPQYEHPGFFAPEDDPPDPFAPGSRADLSLFVFLVCLVGFTGLALLAGMIQIALWAGSLWL